MRGNEGESDRCDDHTVGQGCARSGKDQDYEISTEQVQVLATAVAVKSDQTGVDRRQAEDVYKRQVYGIGVAILNAKIGERLVLVSWFPLLYLAFVIPVPNSILADVTAPLKAFVSWIATGTLAHLGLPVAREGVTIYVAQYQLLVEDACSGMNSLVGLIAVSLLYIYLMRGSSWRYALVLVALVIPVAIIANILRIMLLILMTYGLGNEVAQGILHMTAGLILFATALLLVFGLDSLLHPIFHRRPAA